MFAAASPATTYRRQQDQPPLARRVTLAEGKVTDAAWPVALASAPDGRLFFAELLTGNIRIIQDGKVLPKPFATLKTSPTTGNPVSSALLSIRISLENHLCSLCT